MARTKGAKIKLLKAEKLVFFLIAILIISAPIVSVYSKAKLSETNIKVEQLKTSVSKQENINSSLEMQINELASLEKVQEVAKEIGLAYNNDNVRTINE